MVHHGPSWSLEGLRSVQSPTGVQTIHGFWKQRVPCCQWVLKSFSSPFKSYYGDYASPHSVQQQASDKIWRTHLNKVSACRNSRLSNTAYASAGVLGAMAAAQCQAVFGQPARLDFFTDSHGRRPWVSLCVLKKSSAPSACWKLSVAAWTAGRCWQPEIRWLDLAAT